MKPSELWSIQVSIWTVALLLNISMAPTPEDTRALLASAAIAIGVMFWVVLLVIAYFHER